MDPNDFASLFMLTAAVMLLVGVGSGFVFGLFWRWFSDAGSHERQREVMRTERIGRRGKELANRAGQRGKELANRARARF